MLFRSFAWGNHATYNYATQTYVGTQISNLVNSAPTTLDTLNELATALGSDANFATTVSTNIGVAHAKANAAFGQANAAFTAANNATDTWVRNQANNAYNTANAAFIKANTSTGIKFTASNTTPTGNTVGDQWYYIASDILFEYINDGTSNSWIDISTQTISSNASSGSVSGSDFSPFLLMGA